MGMLKLWRLDQPSYSRCSFAVKWRDKSLRLIQKKKKNQQKELVGVTYFIEELVHILCSFCRCFKKNQTIFFCILLTILQSFLKYWKFVFSNYIEQWTHLQQGSNKQQISCIIDIISPNQNHKYGMHPYKSSNAFLCFLLFIFYPFFPISLAPFFWEGGRFPNNHLS